MKDEGLKGVIFPPKIVVLKLDNVYLIENKAREDYLSSWSGSYPVPINKTPLSGANIDLDL